MMEVREEATYVRHHKQKIALIFSAMRHFADELEADAAGTSITSSSTIRTTRAASPARLRARSSGTIRAAIIAVVEPGEWRVQHEFEQWEDSSTARCEILPDDRFSSEQGRIRGVGGGAQGAPHGVFLPRNAPQDRAADGGRTSRRAGSGITTARTASRPRPTCSCPRRPKLEAGRDHARGAGIGRRALREPFRRSGTFRLAGHPRRGGSRPPTHSSPNASTCFGHYQDAMVEGEDQLYHSLLSTSINLGLLDPLALCRRAEQA